MSTSIAHSRGGELHTEGNPPLLRVRVWLRRNSLDRMLAEGADPTSSAELACRAAQLCSPRCRRSLAAAIKRIVDAAEEPVNPMSAAVPLRRQEILAVRDDLAELADLLQADQWVQVRGMALAERFLIDTGSPLYHPNPEDTLERAVGNIRAALLRR